MAFNSSLPVAKGGRDLDSLDDRGREEFRAAVKSMMSTGAQGSEVSHRHIKSFA
jgi:hypothetical protein